MVKVSLFLPPTVLPGHWMLLLPNPNLYWIWMIWVQTVEGKILNERMVYMHGLNNLVIYSIFSSNPRIRVDIKSEAVSEEDASQSAVALTRVVTLLKEVG